MIPISIWDLDRAKTNTFEFRLGGPDDSYAFNPSGQRLALADLVCGCGLCENDASMPYVTPIKDGMQTKIHAATTRLAAAIYFPLAGDRDLLRPITAELAQWLKTCGESVTTYVDMLAPEHTLVL